MGVRRHDCAQKRHSARMRRMTFRQTTGKVSLANGPLARLFWPVLDTLDYWVTQTRLWAVDIACEPEPETKADRMHQYETRDR